MDPIIPVALATEHIQGLTPATKRAVFLHGMLGRGNNLRTIARRFVEKRPGWDAWLLDLRGHGASTKGSPGPSLQAAAEDVIARCHDSLPVGALIGHSFGGKVALQAAQRALSSIEQAAHTSPLRRLEHVVLLDSNPGVRSPTELQGKDSVLAVLQMLRALSSPFPSRAAFIAAVQQQGHSPTLAQWLAQSTVSTADGRVRFALDLDELQALLLSYLTCDLWPVVEQPPAGLKLHIVIGGRSTSYSPADRDRVADIAHRNPRVTVDVLATDHWVHAEDPDGLLLRLFSYIGS